MKSHTSDAFQAIYSIPHGRVRKPLTLVASPTLVRLLDGTAEIARHVRSYATGATVEDPAHIEALAAAKGNARELTTRDRLRVCVPETADLFAALATRGDSLGYATARLKKLLDDYGADELCAAVHEALAREAYGAGSVAHILEQRRRARGLKPVVPVALPNDPRVRDLRVTPHNLESYDAIGKRKPDPDDDPAQPR